MFFSHGLVGHRTTENTEDFKPPLVVAYYNVDYVKNAKGLNFMHYCFLYVMTNSD